MTQTSPIKQLQTKSADQSCQHIWIIQPATGPLSDGVCESCGESKEFQNYIEASTWRDDKIAMGEEPEESSLDY